MNKPNLKPVPTTNFIKPAFKQAEGHEIPLASAKKHRKKMCFVMMNGDIVNSVVLGFDRFTITIESLTGRPVTIFKHGIFSFCEDV